MLDASARLITREEYDVHVEEWLAAKEAYESEPGHTTQRIEPGALAAYPCLDAEGELSTFGSGPTKAGTRSVLVAARATGNPPCTEVLLAQSVLPIPDLTAAQVTGELTITALLVNDDWSVVAASTPEIYVARETGFFRPLDGSVAHGIHNLEAFIHGGRFGPLYAPVVGAEVDMIIGHSSPRSQTDANGYYELPYRHWNASTPNVGSVGGLGGAISGVYPIWTAELLRYQTNATVRFATFGARERPMMFYMRQRGMTSQRESRSNFAVDVALAEVVMKFVNDRGQPQQVLPLVDPYMTFAPEETTRYERANHRGLGQEVLVTQISVADIRDTDIYLYRVADGRLVGSRWGMRGEEVAGYLFNPNTPASFIPSGCAERACLRATILVRGPGSRVANNLRDIDRESGDEGEILVASDGRGDSIGGSWPYDIAEDADYPGDMPLNLAQTQAAFLGPGDQVQIIAINRATGYMGTLRATMELEPDGTTRIRTGTEPLIMSPPNLRVEARRTYTVQAGATRGARREYLIGFEGSGTTDDTYVEVTTDWVDHDGRALPADLPGYTGRMAAISDGVLPDGRNDQTGLFQIRPGRHQEVLRLPEGGVAQHLYLHVDGAPSTRTFDFAGNVSEAPDFRVNTVCYPGPGGEPQCFAKHAGDGPLARRPADFVPVLVPSYDAAATEALRQQAIEEGDTTPAPQPVYRWLAQAEMQFSLVDFDAQFIRANAPAGSTELLTPNPGTWGGHGLPAGAEELSVEYALAESEDALLGDFIVHERDTDGDGTPDTTVPRVLVLALGDEPMEVTPTQTGTANFEDPSSVNAVGPDGFLALRLIQMSDEANVLWEYAFAQVVVGPTPSESIIYVSVDDPVVHTVGFLLDGEELGDVPTVRHGQWSATGGASIVEPGGGAQESLDKTFSAEVYLSHTPGVQTVVSLTVTDAAGPITGTSAVFETVPGVPAAIACSSSLVPPIGSSFRVSLA
ncbi:MAG: hypothetical protein R3B40_32260 [Polyangiales bacterium]